MSDSRSSGDPNPTPEFLLKLSRWYRELALLTLSTLLLFLGFVLLSYAYYAIPGKGVLPVYSKDFRPRALHRMDKDEALKFFKEFDRLGQDETFIYQPWVGFSERVFHSARLNVDDTKPLPTRRTIQNSSYPAKRPFIVWTFGGSTMFGWGVPDDETIATHLSAILARSLPGRSVTVVNQGHSYYFSSQELALFEVLLRRGERCDAAVFMDGLNDSFPYSLRDVPEFSDRMTVAMAKEQQLNPTGGGYIKVSQDFPPVRLLLGIARKVIGKSVPHQPMQMREPTSLPTLDISPDVRTYQFNLKGEAALGATYGIRTLFFWQPVPDDPLYAQARELATRIRQSVDARDFHFIADIFKDTDAADVYVDYHHYGDIANERIAENIAHEVLAALPASK